jgi:hypothetical protein
MSAIFNNTTLIFGLNVRFPREHSRNGTWYIGLHNLSGSGHKGTLHQFFIKPDLFIEYYNDEDRFSPKSQITNNNEKIDRRDFRVRIVNRGKGRATGCVGKFRLIPRNGFDMYPVAGKDLVSKTSKVTTSPSKESKLLMWADGSKSKDIYPRGEEEMLNILFADSNLKNTSNIFAFVTTREAYLNYHKRLQEAFGLGDFHAELSVKSIEGGYCKANLSIQIDSDISKINIRLSFLDRLTAAWKRRPSISLMISVLLRWCFRRYD